MAIDKRRWIGNSFANVLGGGGTALIALLIPAILARRLTPFDFAIWSLVFQIVAYINFFGFGIQNALAKYIAEEDTDSQWSLTYAGFIIIACGMLIAISALALTIWLYPALFVEVQGERLRSFRIALAAVGLGAIFLLPTQVPIGFFLGKHRNFAAMLPQLATKLFSVAMLWAASLQTDNLLSLIFIFVSMGLLGLPVMLIMLARQGWRPQMFGWREAKHDSLPKVKAYCAGISVWTMSMLLVSAIGPIIVGSYDLIQVAPYTIATAALTVLGGATNALLSPLLPAVSAASLKPEARELLPRVLIRTTFWCVLLLNILLMLFCFVGEPLVRLWVGPNYGRDVYLLVIVLFVGNNIRNCAMPYATMLMGTALHRTTIASALVEGVGNVGSSLILVRHFGAYGVAFGVVIGAALGLVVHVIHNFPRTRLLTPSARTLVFRGMLLPSMPLIIAAAILAVRH